ncbi:putative lumazine-binding protein [Aquimarina sp. MAR_2010_214]|uniref:nuclear transport factor 2 family protein n=1 Tax=Aquimarina sp. MAR_2010_214 TaxID=1250026 RepID=UPI000C701A3A|nr:nuclear transport factor 2 family protein [Aquimarina sp. MAR_2010_214]PKV53132.1 putative lumazine-binding protein [Aquimarina sp. MAR_2010_214]
MKQSFQLFLPLFILILFTSSLSAQKTEKNSKESASETDLSDRQAIIKTIKNFYIGDHTGSIKHKKLSMHEKGAYRYVNKDGEYSESIFRLDSDNADPNYKEELLSIEIYDKLALARLRLDQFRTKLPEYKLMTLHKADGKWKITSITWGFGITQ